MGGMQAQVPTGWQTRSQVAQSVGRSLSTIKRWEKSGQIIPDGTMERPGLTAVRLYSDRYVNRTVKGVAARQHIGRPLKSRASA